MIDFKEYRFGMLRDGVRLSGHNPRWLEAFRHLRDALELKLSGAGIELHHIGSTAIPGIKAKPILDVLGVDITA